MSFITIQGTDGGAARFLMEGEEEEIPVEFHNLFSSADVQDLLLLDEDPLGDTTPGNLLPKAQQEEPEEPEIIILSTPEPPKEKKTSKKAKTSKASSSSRSKNKPILQIAAPTFKNKAEFEAEMDKVINDTINESLHLFQRDPREYHPFYLRVFKYITIGQGSGYISSINEVNSIWEKYDKVCETRMTTKIEEGTITFFGEESPYATFIKTGKVMVNGKEVVLARDAKEIQRKMKDLQKTAEDIVKKWRTKKKKKNNKSEDIRPDLETRLQFFNHCKTVTFPADCVEMNKIWSLFLNQFALAPPSPVKAKTTPTKPPKSVISSSPAKSTSSRRKQNLRQEEAVKVEAQEAEPDNNLNDFDDDDNDDPLPPMDSPPQSPMMMMESTADGGGSSATDTASETEDVEEKTVTFSKKVEVKVISKTVSKKSGEVKLKSNESAEAEAEAKPLKSALKTKSIMKRSNSKLLKRKAESPLSSSSSSIKRKKLGGGSTAAALKRIQKGKKSQANQEKMLSSLEKRICGSSNKEPPKIKSIIKKPSSVSVSSSVPPLKTDEDTSSASKPPTDSSKTNSEITTKNKRMSTSATGNLIKRKMLKTTKRLLPVVGATATQPTKGLLSSSALQRLKNKKKKSLLQQKLKGLEQKKVLSKLEKVICGGASKLKRKKSQSAAAAPTTKMPEAPQNEKESTDAVLALSPPPSPPALDNIDIPDFIINPEELPPEDTISNTELPTMCDECGEICSSKEAIIFHKRTFHPILIKCEICEDEFPSGKELWIHFRKEHTVEGSSLLSEAELACGAMAALPGEEDEEELHPIEKANEAPPAAAQDKDEDEDGKPIEKKALLNFNSSSCFCQICKKSYSDPKSLQRHHETFHSLYVDPEERRNICPHCGKLFKSKDAMNAHVRQVHLGEAHVCDLCGKNLQGAGKLWKHKKEYHDLQDLPPPPGVYLLQCEICGEEMLRGMQRHFERVHPGHQINLKKKSEDFILKKRERDRARRRRKKEQGIVDVAKIHGENRKYGETGSCPTCGKILKLTSIRTHLRRDHGQRESNTGDWPCPRADCFMNFTTKSFLQLHLEEYHFNLVKTVKEIGLVKKKEASSSDDDDIFPEFFCLICQEIMKDSNEIKIHFIFKHGQTLDKLKVPENERERLINSKMSCIDNLCDDKMDNYEMLREHVKGAHPDQLWNCPEENCGSVLLGPEDLQEHFFLEHNNEDSSNLIGKWEEQKQNKLKPAAAALAASDDIAAEATSASGSTANKRKARVAADTTRKRNLKLKFYRNNLKAPENGKVDALPRKKLQHITSSLSCAYCPSTSFQLQDEMINHFNEMHPDKLLKCTICGILSFTEHGALFHSVNYHRIRTESKEYEAIKEKLFAYSGEISCKFCGKIFNYFNFKVHLKNVHELEEDGDRWKCPCPQMFKQRHLWIAHMEEFHGGKKEELMQIAGEMNCKEGTDFGNVKTKKERKPYRSIVRGSAGFRVPSIASKRRRTPRPVDPPMTCHVCLEAFHTHKDMGKHFEEVHPEKLWKCEKCPLPRFTERGYYFHLVAMHKEINMKDLPPRIREMLFSSWMVECKLCSREMKMISYQYHLRRDHGIQEDGEGLKCPCPKTFKVREYWMTHMEELHGGKAEELFEIARRVNVLDKSCLEGWREKVIFKQRIGPKPKSKPKKKRKGTGRRGPAAGGRKRRRSRKPNKIKEETETDFSEEEEDVEDSLSDFNPD